MTVFSIGCTYVLYWFTILTLSPPKVSFGDVWTHPEQEITTENLTVVARLDVLSGSEGSNLTVSIATQYLSDEGIRTLLDTQTLPVVRPRLLTVASVSTRYRKGYLFTLLTPMGVVLTI